MKHMFTMSLTNFVVLYSVIGWVLTESSALILSRRKHKYRRADEKISEKHNIDFVLLESDTAFRTDIDDIAKSHLSSLWTNQLCYCIKYNRHDM